MHDYAALRRRLVDNQIRPSDITDRDLIGAILEIPREWFVAPSEAPFAYSDRELRYSDASPDRRMMNAVQLAKLIQMLPVGVASTAMVVGCGTGYSAAILSRLAASVVAVEEDEALATLARQTLRRAGVENVEVVVAELTRGHPMRAPYDAILLDGAVERVPDALVMQLKAGGMLATVERGERISRAMAYERVEGGSTNLPQFEGWASLLPGFDREREFVF